MDVSSYSQPLPHKTSRSFVPYIDVKPLTICRLRQRLAEEGLNAAVHGKLSHHGRKRKLDGEGQAHLTALAYSTPPEGQCRWTLNLLRDRMVQLEYVDDISRSTIHVELKKTKSNHG